jgi:hypothetical protein
MSATGDGRRRLALPVSVGAVGLGLIMFGQVVLNGHAIEDDLTARSFDALKAADLTGVSVSFSGRDATLTGSANTAKARDVVQQVDGVRVVVIDSTETAAAAATTAPNQAATPNEMASSAEAQATAEPTATASLILPIGFTLAEGTITVTGTVDSESAATELIDAVKAVGNGWTVVNRVNVDDSVTTWAPGPSRLPGITRLLAQAPVDGTKLVIQYSRGSVILRGTPSDAAAEGALLSAAAATVDGKSSVVDGLDTP